MSTLKDRLEEAMRRNPGLRQADLAKACGLSTPSVSNWFRGETRTLKVESARRAAKILGCDQNWLASGIGHPNWDRSEPLLGPEKIWSTDEEARRLAERFSGVAQAKFAREHNVPGGASMLSQHIKGRRPINLESALVYARGFGVSLAEISPRLATQIKKATRAVVSSQEADERGPGMGSDVGQAVSLVLQKLRTLPQDRRAEMSARWAALLLAPDSAELERWLHGALSC